MKKQLGRILAAIALASLLAGCAAPMKSGAKEPCAYPNPYSC
jgi:hypothetical protein